MHPQDEITVDEAQLAAEAEGIAPGFRREAEEIARRSADLVAPLLEGNRAAWSVKTGLRRYVGDPEQQA